MLHVSINPLDKRSPNKHFTTLETGTVVFPWTGMLENNNRSTVICPSSHRAAWRHRSQCKPRGQSIETQIICYDLNRLVWIALSFSPPTVYMWSVAQRAKPSHRNTGSMGPPVQHSSQVRPQSFILARTTKS